MGFRLNAIASLAAVFLLGGCANQPQVVEEDFASKLIAEKSAIAAGAQRDYASLLAEDYSTVLKRQASFETDTVDIDFIGNPKELLQTIASRYGMAFNEMGKSIDLRPVNIRVKGVAPEMVLKNLGNQMDSAADVVFNRSSKTITIEYKNRDSVQKVS